MKLIGALSFILIFHLPIYGEPGTPDPIAAFPSRVHKFVLKNGMRVLVLERPESQTVSFAMYVRTGGLDDESGKSGLAHMFEHMLFKGTKTIGTKNYAKEALLLDQIDQAEQAGDHKKLEELNKEHEKLLEPEEYWRIYERAGGQNLNASTGYDFTNYTVSLPKNQVKLWFAMEADRLKNPVLREFYKERSVVLEERRMRIDTSPQGKLWEAFLAAAFVAHPYGRPIVGWESDISRVTRQDATRFFKQHYDISRLVLAIAGGVKTQDIQKLCESHFASIASTPSPEEIRIPVEPLQEGERRVQVEFDAEPSLLIGYHRPDMRHADEPAFNVLQDILSSGRTSRFNRTIVEKNRIGVGVWAGGSAPGERDPNLFVMGGAPRAPHTVQDLEKAIWAEVEQIQKRGPTEAELEKVKNNLESAVIRGLASNEGLASQLAYYESVAGDWNFLIQLIQGIRSVTALDVKRVAQTYLTESNRTVAVLRRKK
ncbi:MAG: putative zinc protease [Elusimicrobia bacterium]|nr:putative zinc protease [Elusimicrobiota bacterium]